MKKIVTFFAFIFLIIAIALLSYYLVYLIKNPNPITPLALGALGFVISKFYESHKDRQTRLHDKKREVYQSLLAPYRGVLLNSITKKESSKSVDSTMTEEQISSAVNAAFDAIMFASDSVLKSYGQFRNASVDNNYDPILNLKSLANFLQAIRKDLGNGFSSLDEVDILKMFINMDVAQEALLRAKFKIPN